MNSIWKILTSLRLTVICLAAAIVLVFVGTVAQADEGLFQVQERYFRHWMVVGTTMWGWHMPWFVWPGGHTIGFTLLANLVAAHIKRFRWAWSKLGIHLTHAGIVILLVGQLATEMMQTESRMRFEEGQAAGYVERHRERELAFMTDAGAGQDEVVSVPEEFVVKGGELPVAKLPFTVRVKDYSPHGDVVGHAEIGQLTTALATLDGQFSTADGLVAQAERAEGSEGRLGVWRAALEAVGEDDARDVVAAAKRVAAQPERAARLCTELKARFREQMTARFAMQGPGMREVAEKLGAGQPLPPELLQPASSEGAGSRATAMRLPEPKDMDSRSLPFAVLELAAAGKSLGTWLVSPVLRAQEIKVGEKTWRVAYRDERGYLPFSLKLLQATHKKYAGSDTPKDFRSRVLIENAATREHREVEISMNDPLRYGGLAFYQYQMTKDELDQQPGSSVLQVVRNPSWLAPYIGCIVVAVGMIWQFLHHLIGFITKRRSA